MKKKKIYPFNIKFPVTRREFVISLIKVVIYLLSLVLVSLGAGSLSSCAPGRPSISVSQRGIIVVNDTIFLGYPNRFSHENR